MLPPGDRDLYRLYEIYRTSGMGADATELDRRRGRAAHLIHNVLPHVPEDRSIVIADVACGSGELLALLKQAGYDNVLGVDISAEQIAQVATRGLDCAEEGDAFDFLRARRAQFHVVLAIDFLEHLKKPNVLDLLRLIRDALRPGGRLILQTCNAKSPFFGGYRYGDFTHETAFTAESVRQVLRTVGFSTITIQEVQPASRTLFGYVRRGLWPIMRLPLVLYLAAETGVLRGHVLSQNLIAVADKI
jgi:2-polyprenyl-3-methyl-5-hydroxy-6-metoxy-1,4-benzoquinol methylase